MTISYYFLVLFILIIYSDKILCKKNFTDGPVVIEKVAIALNKTGENRPPKNSYEKDPGLRKIAFFGDSMLKTPEKYFNISGQFKKELLVALNLTHPAYSFMFKIEVVMHNAAGGRLVEVFRNSIDYLEKDYDKNRHMTDILVIYQDSDLDDLRDMTKQGVSLQPKYREYEFWLNEALKYLKKRVGRVIIVGPTLHGATGEIPNLWKKDIYVNEMNSINSRVCKLYNTSHLNTRSIFQERILNLRSQGKTPKNLMFYRGKQWPMNLTEDSTYGGLLTFDGDHLNLAGSKLLVKELVKAVVSFDEIWQKPIYPSELSYSEKLKWLRKFLNVRYFYGLLIVMILLFFCVNCLVQFYQYICMKKPSVQKNTPRKGSLTKYLKDIDQEAGQNLLKKEQKKKATELPPVLKNFKLAR